jgi:hypothetical protein
MSACVCACVCVCVFSCACVQRARARPRYLSSRGTLCAARRGRTAVRARGGIRPCSVAAAAGTPPPPARARACRYLHMAVEKGHVGAAQLKNFAAAAPLMKFVTLGKLHSQYGKAKEASKVRAHTYGYEGSVQLRLARGSARLRLQEYSEAVKSYEDAHDFDAVVRVYLTCACACACAACVCVCARRPSACAERGSPTAPQRGRNRRRRSTLSVAHAAPRVLSWVRSPTAAPSPRRRVSGVCVCVCARARAQWPSTAGSMRTSGARSNSFSLRARVRACALVVGTRDNRCRCRHVPPHTLMHTHVQATRRSRSRRRTERWTRWRLQ